MMGQFPHTVDDPSVRQALSLAHPTVRRLPTRPWRHGVRQQRACVRNPARDGVHAFGDPRAMTCMRPKSRVRLQVESTGLAMPAARSSNALHRRLLNAIVVGLLVAAAVGTWILSQRAEPEAELARTGDGTPPTYYLRDAVMLRTDESGRVLYRIHADLAEEQPGADALLLTGVRVEYREDEQVPWHVRAGRASAWLEEQTLELEDGVELIRTPEGDGPPATVRAEQLLLEPLRHIASAEGEVWFTLGANEIVAVGLKAFLKEDRLELESDVHGRLQP